MCKMIIYNEETWEPIYNPDLSLGKVENRFIPIVHTYVDGAWETRNAETKELVPYDGIIFEGTPKDKPFENTWAYAVYIPFTDEEHAEYIAVENAAIERAEWFLTAPEQAADLDEAVVTLYEAQIKAQLDTDEALVALYEAML